MEDNKFERYAVIQKIMFYDFVALISGLFPHDVRHNKYKTLESGKEIAFPVVPDGYEDIYKECEEGVYRWFDALQKHLKIERVEVPIEWWLEFMIRYNAPKADDVWERLDNDLLSTVYQKLYLDPDAHNNFPYFLDMYRRKNGLIQNQNMGQSICYDLELCISWKKRINQRMFEIIEQHCKENIPVPKQKDIAELIHSEDKPHYNQKKQTAMSHYKRVLKGYKAKKAQLIEKYSKKL